MIAKKGSDDAFVMNKSLQKVAKGSSIVFIGLLLGLLPAFIARLIIVRYWTESDYGVFSLAVVVLTICLIISTLGLTQGVSRNIAYARGKKEYTKIQEFISASIWFSTLASILVGIVLFLFSEMISVSIFHEPALITPLRIFSLALPFSTLISVIISIFRGFDQIKPVVYFQQILLNVIFPLLLVVIVFSNLSFIFVFYAYAGAITITLILLIVYSLRKIQFSSILSIKSITSPASKELLIFSLPLLITVVLTSVMSWTDTLMIGGLKSTVDVGLYNAASPLARFISFPLAALLVIYMPVFSGLYAKNKLDEIKRNYSILTKWLCSATLPLFAILFLFPEPIITLLFGSTYAPSSGALRILSLGFIANNFVGPCSVSLIGMGKSRFVMLASLFAAVLNIGLNTALIPSFGLIGAATASVISLSCINLIRSWKLYSISGAKPLSKNLVKPVLVSLGIIGIIYVIFQNFITMEGWMLPVILLLFYIIYILAMLITKSLDQEDLKMLQILEEKTGFKSNLLRRLLLKFQ